MQGGIGMCVCVCGGGGGSCCCSCVLYEHQAHTCTALFMVDPKVFEYAQEDISQMLALREQLNTHPQWKTKMADIAVFSFWVETAMSALLHKEIYNFHKTRKYLHYFLTYFLPVVFTFQVVGIVR